MAFGQLVVGPPGSGKTTYCYGLQQFYEVTGRPVAVINLDPANDNLSYDCAVDVADLVCLETVQEEFHLGPNGGLIYCIEYLEQNLDWLIDRLKPLAEGTNITTSLFIHTFRYTQLFTILLSSNILQKTNTFYSIFLVK
jgi:GPN-loop GTPase